MCQKTSKRCELLKLCHTNHSGPVLLRHRVHCCIYSVYTLCSENTPTFVFLRNS